MIDNSAVFCEVEKFLRNSHAWQDSNRPKLLRIMREIADNELQTPADRDRAADLATQLESRKRPDRPWGVSNIRG